MANMKDGHVIDAGVTNFDSLPNNNQWVREEVCLPITGAGNDLRIQLYPALGGKTLAIDGVTLNQDVARNGGFEQGPGLWIPTINTNFTTYDTNNALAGGAQPYEGSHFGATNATGGQASIYQDIALPVKNGDEYCVTAMLTSADASGSAGAFGDLNLYVMNGGNVVSGGSTHFSKLPNNNLWVPTTTCAYATGSGNDLRVQLYPGLSSPTVGIDAVNMNQDLIANAGFELGMGWWNTYQGTNKTTYIAGNTLTGGTNPPEGNNFGATNAYQAGGSIYQDLYVPIGNGNAYCATALLTTADESGTPGGSGDLNLYAMSGGNVVSAGSTHFSDLPNHNQWKEVETCVNITGNGDHLRLQLYPTVNGKTLGIDAVNVF
jgi:hypothetical protein